jgi:hypothetical protein
MTALDFMSATSNGGGYGGGIVETSTRNDSIANIDASILSSRNPHSLSKRRTLNKY